MSGSVFDHIKAATELRTYDTKIYFLDQKFTCKGTLIKKWVIGARLEHYFEYPGYIQVLYRKFELAPLTTTSHINVYEYELNPPVAINRSSLSISVNSPHIYYQYCARLTGRKVCRDHPLVAVDVGKSHFVSSTKNKNIHLSLCQNAHIIVNLVPNTSLEWRSS